jgi:hypothetical protein
MTYTCSVRRRRGGAWLSDRQAWRLAGDEDGYNGPGRGEASALAAAAAAAAI